MNAKNIVLKCFTVYLMLLLLFSYLLRTAQMSFWEHLLHFFTVILLVLLNDYFYSSYTCWEKHFEVMALFIFKKFKFPFRQRKSWVKSYQVQKVANAQIKKKMF